MRVPLKAAETKSTMMRRKEEKSIDQGSSSLPWVMAKLLHQTPHALRTYLKFQ